MRDITKVADLCEGLIVEIETREGATTGKLIEIITKRDNPKGIKVRIESGETGRIKKLVKDLEEDNNEVSNEGAADNEKQEQSKVNSSNSKNKADKKVNIKERTVIDVRDKDILDFGNGITKEAKKKKYEITTKFFKNVYCKRIHDELKGVIIFRVRAENIELAVYKINKYLKKFCTTKDIKYEVVTIVNKE